VPQEQLLKGVLDIVVLAAVAREESYGYDIVQQLRKSGLEAVGEASVYGTLRRLEQQRWLSSKLVASTQGPARRYYRLTAIGGRALDALLRDWHQITDAVDVVTRNANGRR